jgi:hypothetical protein
MFRKFTKHPADVRPSWFGGGRRHSIVWEVGRWATGEYVRPQGGRIAALCAFRVSGTGSSAPIAPET